MSYHITREMFYNATQNEEAEAMKFVFVENPYLPIEFLVQHEQWVRQTFKLRNR